LSENAPPKLFEHCSTVYEAMKKKAEPGRYEGRPALVYEGFITQLFAEKKLATPYYTQVLRRLKAMGCIHQISRGGGNSPSRWQIIREPDFDTFEKFEEKRRKTNTKLGQTVDIVNFLMRRVDILEAKVEVLEKEKAS
jgi:hypothetical protein